MKWNHLMKLMHNEPNITLSGDSTFNYILYSDVLDVATLMNIEGTYDLVSKGNVNLHKIKSIFKSSTKLGTYLYKTPKQFTNPIELDKTSIETIKSYFS